MSITSNCKANFVCKNNTLADCKEEKHWDIKKDNIEISIFIFKQLKIFCKK